MIFIAAVLYETADHPETVLTLQKAPRRTTDLRSPGLLLCWDVAETAAPGRAGGLGHGADARPSDRRRGRGTRPRASGQGRDGGGGAELGQTRRASASVEPLERLLRWTAEAWAHARPGSHAWRGFAVYPWTGRRCGLPTPTTTASTSVWRAGGNLGDSGCPLVRLVTLMALRSVEADRLSRVACPPWRKGSTRR